MVRGFGSVVGAVVLLSAGAFVSWAPEASASCDKSYPPCICQQALALPCSGNPFVTLAGVQFAAHLERDSGVAGSAGYVVFTFRGAPENGSVPFFIDLEAAEDVEWSHGEDTHYVHGNDTTATEVRVYQHFLANEDPEIRFTLTAHQGTPREESLEGALGFNEAAGESEESGVSESVVIAGALGLIIGAIIAAVVVMSIRRS
ncbi:MAG: hypothetical protein ACYC2H_11145 [Thermoplasmatota archaeon]